MGIVNYGYTFNQAGEITGKIDRLRYSALNLWLHSKQGYRDRYYEGKTFSNAETVFGREIHKLLESPSETANHPVLRNVPRFPVAEFDIATEIAKIKIGGCIDSFDPETKSFLDYKSSHLSSTGKLPWDRVKVSRQMQLVFYALLIQLEFGTVNRDTQLVWLETAFRDKHDEFDGHILTAPSRELHLTGKFEVFKRKIFKWEIEALRQLIIKSATEINQDFQNYGSKETIGSDERIGEVVA